MCVELPATCDVKDSELECFYTAMPSWAQRDDGDPETVDDRCNEGICAGTDPCDPNPCTESEQCAESPGICRVRKYRSAM
eukprot:TRINITY_DN5023_c0_g1_i1.p2 TRINITY_DN5023_c0_g1~~TRINITY_DN5023_c0_g1_i1.p2  ORF type:complete len:80 (+),score=13.63 TRINITY_DN5023_c0_g1_i1:565-804(+)